MSIHPTLARQLAKAGAHAAAPPTPSAWASLLERVSRTYQDADQDRYLVERSLAVSSREMRELHQSLSQSAAEQSALLRIATAVAQGSTPESLFDTVSFEAASLLGVEGGRVLRLVDEDHCEIVGAWGATGRLGRAGILNGAIALTSVTAATITLRTGEPTVVHDYADSPDPTSRALLRRSFRGGAAAPIVVGSQMWGAVSVLSTRRDAFVADVERRLAAFASLISLALVNAAAVGGLRLMADTDPLTGLLNHRAFHERLAEQIAAAHAGSGRLCLAIFDIDHFKQVNDCLGHQAGDQVLAEIAARVRAVSRPGCTLGRIGGEEFGWILPDLDHAAAIELCERARRAVRESPVGPGLPVTMSLGVSAIAPSSTPQELLRLADRALYAAKRAGRDNVQAETDDLPLPSAAGQAQSTYEHDERRHALLLLAGISSDRSSPVPGHGARVADLCARIARLLDWAPERIARLHEAALLHDIGKLAISPEILGSASPLSGSERRLIEVHAATGAQMVAGILDPEQAEWIAHHHERWDGTGYPDGLRKEQIPDGSLLIAVAEAWDAMTSIRSYRTARGAEEAAEEIRHQSGRHFSPVAAGALLRLLDGAHAPTAATDRAA